MARELLTAPPWHDQGRAILPPQTNLQCRFSYAGPKRVLPRCPMHEPKSLSALRSSLRARDTFPSDRKSPFSFGPRHDYPIDHHKKGSFLFHLALHIFYFSTGIIVFVSIGPQLYARIKQGKLKTLVTTMALYKIPSAEALNGTLPWSAPIIPNGGHAKYVYLDPWINALVTLASLGTIIAFLIIRCRKRTLCRGLEYATACHIYICLYQQE